MNHDSVKLSKVLDSVALNWDISGHIMLAEAGEVLYQKSFGFADRASKAKTKKDTRYVLSLSMPLLLGIAILRLMEEKNLDLKDKVSTYIPELKEGNRITIEDLMRRRSGLIDYYYGVLMLHLNNDQSHRDLPVETRMAIEQEHRLKHQSLEQVLALINDKALEFEPGTVGFPPSETELIVLMGIICKITGLSAFDSMKKLVFEPLNMQDVRPGQQTESVSYRVYEDSKLVRMPLDYAVADTFTMTLADGLALVKAISLKQGLKSKTWAIASRFDAEGLGLIFENANGFICSRIELLGFGFYLYFQPELSLAFAALVNEEQTFKHEEGQWQFFRKSLRNAVDSHYTYPRATKMVRINKDNFWDALSVSVEQSQLDFVLDAKSSIAMGLLHKTKKVFVQMEGKKAIGILVLDIDHKRSFYDIDIIQVDKRFQGRGYGKMMLAFAVDYLKKAGAKELLIGVNRYNYAAQKIYMDAGFKPKKIHEEGMQLQLIFEA